MTGTADQDALTGPGLGGWARPGWITWYRDSPQAATTEPRAEPARPKACVKPEAVTGIPYRCGRFGEWTGRGTGSKRAEESWEAASNGRNAIDPQAIFWPCENQDRTPGAELRDAAAATPCYTP